MQRKIVEALTKEGSPGVAPILKRFGGKAKSLKAASTEIYCDNYKLLTGVLFGWDIDERYKQ